MQIYIKRMVTGKPSIKVKIAQENHLFRFKMASSSPFFWGRVKIQQQNKQNSVKTADKKNIKTGIHAPETGALDLKNITDPRDRHSMWVAVQKIMKHQKDLQKQGVKYVC